MATLQVRLGNLATRVATECKALRILISNNAADLSALTTTAKSNLVAAVNELVTSVAGKQANLGFTPENAANKGQANGYVPLDGSTKIASTYLPSYVDDVLEYANLAALPATGAAGILYITLNDNKEFRWSGSTYVAITASPGTTDNVPEGSANLYFTNARAVSALAATLGNPDDDLVAVFNAGLV